MLCARIESRPDLNDPPVSTGGIPDALRIGRIQAGSERSTGFHRWDSRSSAHPSNPGWISTIHRFPPLREKEHGSESNTSVEHKVSRASGTRSFTHTPSQD